MQKRVVVLFNSLVTTKEERINLRIVLVLRLSLCFS